MTPNLPFVTREQAIHYVDQWKAENDVIVFTNGCFDLFHAGHAIYLKQAKALGDRLVIGLNSDESVRQLKGSSRPIVSAFGRATVLTHLSSVDLVVLFDEPTPEDLLSHLQPHIHVKGGDYTDLSQLPEHQLVQSYGGTVKLLPFVPDFSTSRIIEKIMNHIVPSKNGSLPT